MIFEPPCLIQLHVSKLVYATLVKLKAWEK